VDLSALHVSDFNSNVPENLEQFAKALAKSAGRQLVFDIVYTGKKATKTVAFIREQLRSRYSKPLSEKQVLMLGKPLVHVGLFDQVKDKATGRVAYQKRGNVYHHKSQILALARSKAKRDALATKRRPALPGRNGHVPVTIAVPIKTRGLQVRRITIDDVDSFSKAKRLKVDGFLLNAISEPAFRDGVKRILGEPGAFKDWGGEPNDLYTSRLRLRKRRVTAAFAFKGPGMTGKLVPGKMGKNGDQIQRLFRAPADVFFVQYVDQVDQSVYDQMHELAYARAWMTNRPVYHGVIDGNDSLRLFRAYASRFRARPAKPSKRANRR
jgi:hypothetical protein